MDTTQPHRRNSGWSSYESQETNPSHPLSVNTTRIQGCLWLYRKLNHCRKLDMKFTEQCQTRLFISTPETFRSLGKRTPATSTPAQQQQQTTPTFLHYSQHYPSNLTKGCTSREDKFQFFFLPKFATRHLSSEATSAKSRK